MKNQLNSRKQKGFSIIEILIVLAVAGLILAVVFLAVPQLQRNARDSARQSVATRLSAEMETYASNNGGKYPFTGVPGAFAVCTTITGAGSCNDFYTRYIQNKVDIKDPSTGNDVTINISSSATTPAWAAGNVWVSAGNRCNGEAFTAGNGGGVNARSYAMLVALDRSNTFYCVDND